MIINNLTYQNCIGQRVAKLTILKTNGRNNQGAQLYLCQCDCGNTTTVTLGNLKRGTQSCGCYNKKLVIKRNISRTTHGLRKHRLYGIWQGMKSRCYYKNQDKYKYYGGKGIKICDEWLKNFKTFYEWSLNNGYDEDLTIDRINGDSNYEPNNCRWVTMIIQNQNRKFNKKKCENNYDLTGLSHIDKKELFKYELLKRIKNVNQV